MRILRQALALLVLFGGIASAAPKTKPKGSSDLEVSVRMPSGVRAVYAIAATGEVFSPTIRGSTSVLTIPGASVEGSSLYAVSTSGQTIGPVFAAYGSKARLFFAKSPMSAKGTALRSVALSVKAAKDGQGYLMVNKSPKGNVFDKKYQYRPSMTPPLGLNAGKVSRCVPGKAPTGDLDCDGVVNALDTDVNGNGLSNVVEGSASASFAVIASSANRRKSAPAESTQNIASVPFTTLYLPMGQTVNWHLNGSLSPAAIDAVIGGENLFAIAFFFSPPSDASAIAGGHLVCDSSLVYCRPTEGANTGTAIYSGFMEGDRSLVGQRWSDIRTDGSEYSLETFRVGSNTAIAAAIQPRVGTSAFRAGDNYRIDFTNAARTVISSATLTLPPYFVTAPAIRAFNTTGNDAGSDIVVNYPDTNGVGMTPGNPIVLASTGDFAGKLRLSVWRLQRQAVGSEATTAPYYDYGHLNYGVVINNNAGEFTCGGLYEQLSSTLTEAPSLGTGGSYLTRDGASLWPLVDSADDYAPSSATDSTTVGNNTIAFTVNLSSCLTRNGLTSGVHQVTVFAAGGDTGHGANRAAQTFHVSIP